MTENEAIEIIKNFPKWNLDDLWLTGDEMDELVEMAIKALKEIPQYHTIGTVKTCQLSVEICKAMIERGIEPDNIKEYIKFEDNLVQRGYDLKRLLEMMDEIKQYRAIGTVNEFKALKEDWLNRFDRLIEYCKIGTEEECWAAVEKEKDDKELESHDEKHILKYCISLMWELVGKFEEWYEYVHGEDAIKELDEQERFCYRMTYFNIVQELFLFGTSHSGGTSTRAKCEQLGVDSSDEIEFSFGDDEE